MSQELLQQTDFARRLADELGKPVSKQNVAYYKSKNMLVMVPGFIVKDPGSTSFLKGDCISKIEFERENGLVEKNGGAPATGKLSKLVDYHASLTLLNKKIDPSHNQKFASAPGAAPSNPNSPHPAKGADAFDYTASKARNEHYKSEISRMEAEEKAGRLTLVREVEDQAYTCASRVRDSLMDIPYHMSSTLAAMTDPDKIEELLSYEIEKALKGLSETFKDEAEEESA